MNQQFARVAITGANGFVGHALCVEADARGFLVRGVTRTHSNQSPAIGRVVVANIDVSTDWCEVLDGCQALVHLAARVHVMKDAAANPLTEFRRVNVQGTLNLARQAAAVGVRRFVFISSIKVNGESTRRDAAFTAADNVAPLDAYGMSKMEAEQGLRDLAAQTGMEVVIIRPPLVYGPGVKANFATMIRWLNRGVPLPLGAIHNRRSLVALDNLVDLILLCITHPAAANQTFLVSDDEDVSTTALLQKMGRAMSKPARLIPVPESWLRTAAKIIGKTELAQRLCGSLQVDISKTRELLGWIPPISLDEGLRRACK